jgi:hypothetical protein
MKGRSPTAEEKRYLSAVADLGCIVCHLHYGQTTPAEIHHIDGKTKPGAHFQVLPLCWLHHRSGRDDFVGASRHSVHARGGKRAFEARYGTEAELLEKVQELLSAKS